VAGDVVAVVDRVVAEALVLRGTAARRLARVEGGQIGRKSR
jgi:hypothetical protein